MRDGVCSCGDPACKNPAKHPLTPRGHRDATIDPAQIRRWAEVAPNANIATAIPDGFAVIDVDPRHDGKETIVALMLANGKLPSDRMAETGGGGWHIWTTIPPGWRLPSRLGDGVDVKQAGGYVLLPPSNHASGGAYRWIAEGRAAPAPGWVVERGHPKGESSTTAPVEVGEPSQDPRLLDAVAARLEPHYVLGKRHHTAKALGGWLKQRGFNPGDVAHVIRQLPSNDPEARVKAALAAFAIEKPFGFDELGQLLGEDVRTELDKTTPNPRWTAELASREQASTLVAAAVAQHGVVPLANAPHAAPFSEGDPLFAPWDIGAPVPPLNYLIQELELAPGRVNMIAGYSNVGKTTIAQALAFSIAMGLPVFGRFAPRRARVLHLDYEAGEVARENYQRLARGHGVDVLTLRDWLTAGSCGLFLDAPQAEVWLLQRCAGFGLVLIDTLRASSGALDENKPEIARPLYMLGRVSHATGATIIVLHHERKPEGVKRTAPEHMISGHNAIHGALQVAYSLERDDDSGLVRFTSSKRLRQAFESFSLCFLDLNDPAVEQAAIGEAVAAAGLPGTPSWGLRVEIEAPKPADIETPSAREEREARELEHNALKIINYFRNERTPGIPAPMPALKAKFHWGTAPLIAALDLLIQRGELRREYGAPERYSLNEPPNPATWAADSAPPTIPEPCETTLP
jgi:hypothetical protein